MFLRVLILLCCAWQTALAALPEHPPQELVKQWLLDEGGKSMGLHLNATLATAVNNKPSIRMVHTFVGEDGRISFTTHANTEKVLHQKINPNVALHYSLSTTRRQISIEGKMLPLPKEQLQTIWQTMPRWMQLHFLASDHVSPMPSPNYVNEKIEKLDKEFEKDIPRPKEFVGFSLEPSMYLFYTIKVPSPAEKFYAQKRKGEWVWEQLQP